MDSDITDTKIGEIQYFFEKPGDEKDVKRGLYDHLDKVSSGTEQNRFAECLNELVLHQSRQILLTLLVEDPELVIPILGG